MAVYLTLPVPEERLQPLTIQGTSDNPNRDDNVIDPDDYELDARPSSAGSTDCGSTTTSTCTGPAAGAAVVSDHPGRLQCRRRFRHRGRQYGDQGRGYGGRYPGDLHRHRDSNPNPALAPSQAVVVRSKMEQPGGDLGLLEPVFTRLSDAGHVIPSLSPDGTPVLVRLYDNIRLYHDIA
ncbi:hypothetical protein QNM99_23090 [Pseudomonas sp. PCH446]